MAEILNVDIARRLEDVVRLLKEQGANPYRVRAYHRAATTRRWLGRPVTEMLQQEGVEGLRKLPGLGESLTRTIHDLVVTGRLPRLDRLRGEMDPVSRFASVPGIGTVLAEHRHCELGIVTLEELAAAAHEGCLAEIAGVGEQKLAGVIDSLATRLERVRAPVRRPATVAPAVEERLDVDREYREQAAVGKRRRIAPRRFNPSGEVWLPV
jgi:DNA polymerase (family 10)